MAQLDLHTRQRTQIENDHVQIAPTPGEMAYADSIAHKHPAAVRRPTNVTTGYNCHGLTFAARRTWIAHASEIATVLVQDGYRKLASRNEAIAGDIVVYRSTDGDLEHSGVIVDVPQGPFSVPRVLSKWGGAQEFLHSLFDCPYPPNVDFYRLEQ